MSPRLLGHVRVERAGDAVTIRGLSQPVANELVGLVAIASLESAAVREHGHEVVTACVRAAGFIASCGVAS